MAKIGDNASLLFQTLVPNNDWKNGEKTYGDLFSKLMSGKHPIRADDINELRDAFYNLSKLLSNDVAIGNNSGQMITPFNNNQLFVTNGAVVASNPMSMSRSGWQIPYLNWNIKDYNYADVFPPKGFNMWNYIGGLVSIHFMQLGGWEVEQGRRGIDGHAIFYAKDHKLNDRVRLVGGCNEMAWNDSGDQSHLHLNYILFWAKHVIVPASNNHSGRLVVNNDGRWAKF